MRIVGRLLKYGTLISTLGFAACVLLQVFARLLLPTAPSWTEEAARLFFVLAIGFAAGLAQRSSEYVQFDFFFERLSVRWQARMSVAIDALTVLLFGLFTAGAVRFTLMGLAERSPSLKFPMAVPFSAMVVLGAGILVFAVYQLRRVLAKADAPASDASSRPNPQL